MSAVETMDKNTSGRLGKERGDGSKTIEKQIGGREGGVENEWVAGSKWVGRSVW